MRFHSDSVLMTTGQLTVVFPFVPNEVYLWSFVVLPTNLDQCDDAVPPSWIFILLLCYQPGSLFQWCVTNLDPCSSDMSQTWTLVPVIMSQTWILVPVICHKLGSLFRWLCHKLGSLFWWYITNLDPCSGDVSQNLDPCSGDYVTNLDPCSGDMSQTWILVLVLCHKPGSPLWHCVGPPLLDFTTTVPPPWTSYDIVRPSLWHCAQLGSSLWCCATDGSSEEWMISLDSVLEHFSYLCRFQTIPVIQG